MNRDSHLRDKGENGIQQKKQQMHQDTGAQKNRSPLMNCKQFDLAEA